MNDELKYHLFDLAKSFAGALAVALCMAIAHWTVENIPSILQLLSLWVGGHVTMKSI